LSCERLASLPQHAGVAFVRGLTQIAYAHTCTSTYYLSQHVGVAFFCGLTQRARARTRTSTQRPLTVYFQTPTGIGRDFVIVPMKWQTTAHELCSDDFSGNSQGFRDRLKSVTPEGAGALPPECRTAECRAAECRAAECRACARVGCELTCVRFDGVSLRIVSASLSCVR